MLKHIQSHENNNFSTTKDINCRKNLSVTKAIEALGFSPETRMLDPEARPFLEAWNVSQNELKSARVNPLNNVQKTLPLPASFLDYCRVPDTIESNESGLAEVPSYYLNEEYVDLCNKYHIPFKAVYHNYRELDAIEQEIADYMDLLNSAKNLCIYWNTSTYDPEGLSDAIEEYHSEEADYGYFADLNSDRWAYYNSLGV